MQSLLPVLLINFIGAMGFSIVLPFLIFLVQDFGGNAFIYGVVGATYPAFQFFGAPVLGRWSDRFGRRKVLLLSQAGTLASWLLFSVALYLPRDTLTTVSAPVVGEFELTIPLLVLFFARAVDGLTGGNISVANAYVADVSTDETRSRNFGRMGVAFSAGTVAGPALASLLSATALGNQLPVFAAAAISVVALVVIWAMLPHTTPTPTHELDQDHRHHAAHSLGVEHVDCHSAHRLVERRPAVIERPEIRYMLVLQFVILLGFNLYYAAFPVYAAEGLAWTVERTGLYFMTLSIFLVIIEGPVLSRLSGRYPDSALIFTGLLVLAAHFVAMRYATDDLIFAATLLFAVGNGLMWPTLSSFTASLVDSAEQGLVQGLSGSTSSAASIGGLIVGGVLFTMLAANVFLLSALLFGLAAMLATRLPRVREAAFSQR